MTVRDYREAAEASEKLADKFTEIRALTLFRWKVTGRRARGRGDRLALVDLVYGRLWLWVAVLVLSALLAILGRRRDGSLGGRRCSPGRAR